MSAAVEATRARLREALAQAPVAAYEDEQGGFSVPLGSTAANLTVVERPGGHTAVEIWAVVLADAPLGADLHAFVVETSFLFGRLVVEPLSDGVGQVLLTHAVVGETLRTDRFLELLGTLVTTADEVDDELVARFGGRRFHDG